MAGLHALGLPERKSIEQQLAVVFRAVTKNLGLLKPGRQLPQGRQSVFRPLISSKSMGGLKGGKP